MKIIKKSQGGGLENFSHFGLAQTNLFLDVLKFSFWGWSCGVLSKVATYNGHSCPRYSTSTHLPVDSLGNRLRQTSLCGTPANEYINKAYFVLS